MVVDASRMAEAYGLVAKTGRSRVFWSAIAKV